VKEASAAAMSGEMKSVANARACKPTRSDLIAESCDLQMGEAGAWTAELKQKPGAKGCGQN
jgi:hypothetical protein